MSPELDKQLCEKYPKIFKDRYGNMADTCMVWGFDCGDGWYHIISNLCFLMQQRIDNSIERYEFDTKYNQALAKMAEGDDAEFKEIFSYLSPDNFEAHKLRSIEGGPRPLHTPHDQVVATQVKEKFGGLRFYVKFVPQDPEKRCGDYEYFYGLIDMAGALSYNTCEVCGNKGEVRTDGWHMTLCDKHYREKRPADVED